jgi:hypothetical protein
MEENSDNNAKLVSGEREADLRMPVHVEHKSYRDGGFSGTDMKSETRLFTTQIERRQGEVEALTKKIVATSDSNMGKVSSPHHAVLVI